MCSRLRVATKSTEFGHLEVESIFKPVYGFTRATGKDLDQVVAS